MDVDAARELARKTAFLSQPAAYGEPTSRVEAIETHMSWVFLTDTRAYKLKKPFSTAESARPSLELRKERCDEEVRLNRRLTENVYLGLSPLLEAPGGYRLSTELLQPDDAPPENVADWLVTMVRLPGEL